METADSMLVADNFTALRKRLGNYGMTEHQAGTAAAVMYSAAGGEPISAALAEVLPFSRAVEQLLSANLIDKKRRLTEQGWRVYNFLE